MLNMTAFLIGLSQLITTYPRAQSQKILYFLSNSINLMLNYYSAVYSFLTPHDLGGNWGGTTEVCPAEFFKRRGGRLVFATCFSCRHQRLLYDSNPAPEGYHLGALTEIFMQPQVLVWVGHFWFGKVVFCYSRFYIFLVMSLVQVENLRSCT